jgi:alcohol dehydrogenase
MRFQFFIPTKIFFGRNSIELLPHIIAETKARSICLVTGKNILKKTGIVKRIRALLKGVTICVQSNVTENPTISQVKECLADIKNCKPDIVLAIGGGSVLDLAKAAALLARQPAKPEDYFFGKAAVVRAGYPVIAMPTTAGTSSEITPFSVITFPEKGTKITLNTTKLCPAYAVIDPLLGSSAPRQVIASSGIDVLSHAMEAFCNIQANPLTDRCAVEAMSIVFLYAEKAYAGHGAVQRKALEQMSLACIYAGFAFAHTKTTLSHAISYPLTTFFNVSHGLACGLSLAAFFQFTAPAIRSKMRLLEQALGVSGPAAVVKKINALMKGMGCKTRLREFNITQHDLKKIASYAHIPQKLKNMPRPISKNQLQQLLLKIY